MLLYADYAPWPLWGDQGLLSENDLPLSSELKVRIKRWLNAYDTPVYPEVGCWTPVPGTLKGPVEGAWVAEGEAIRCALQVELGAGYKVMFQS